MRHHKKPTRAHAYAIIMPHQRDHCCWGAASVVDSYSSQLCVVVVRTISLHRSYLKTYKSKKLVV